MKPRSEVTGHSRVSGNAPVLIAERRHEVWHRDPLGDFEGAIFDLPTPVKLEHIQKAAVQCWNGWVSMQGREGKVPASQPRIQGPIPIPEYDNLDIARYTMVCRWKRTSPLLVDVDEAAILAETEAPNSDEMYRVFIENMTELGKVPLAQMEREVRRNEAFADVIDRDEQHRERIRRMLKGA